MIRRLYDPKNIPKLIEYGKRWHDKTPFRNLPFSSKNCDALLRSAFMSPNHAVWGAFDGNKVRGVLIGAICAYPFFEASYATDIIFIADRDGEQLFRAFRQWAASHGAKALQLGVTSGDLRAGKFYEAQGMQRLGGIYFQEIGQ